MNLFTSRLAFSIFIIFLVDVYFVNHFNQSKWHRKKHKSTKKLVVYRMTQLENRYQNANNNYHEHVTKEV